MTNSHRVTWTICLLLVAGCTSPKETEKTTDLDRPRPSGGILLKDSPAEWAERWSKMMAEAEAETTRRAVAASTPTAEAAKEPAAAVTDAPATSEWPDGSGKIFDLPRLSLTEISELMDAVVRRLQTNQSYDAAPEPAVVQRVPALPDGVKRDRLLARVEGETTRVLRMGYWDYRSRTPQFVVYGATLGTEELSADPVVEQFEELLNDVLARRVGIPITLCLICIEVGRRVGIPLVAIGMPGHLLIRHQEIEGWFIDPFNGGILISKDECAQRLMEISENRVRWNSSYLAPIGNREFVARMLRNLKGIYLDQKDYPRALDMLDRLVIIHPKAEQELRDRGVVHYRLERYEDALDDFESYLDCSAPGQDTRSVEKLMGQIRQSLGKESLRGR